MPGVCSRGMLGFLCICIASNCVMLGLPNNKFFGPAKLGRGTSRENHLFSPPMKFRDIFLRITTWLVLDPHLVAHLASDLVGKMVIQKAHSSSSRSAQPGKLFGSSHIAIIFSLICFFGGWKTIQKILSK